MKSVCAKTTKIAECEYELHYVCHIKSALRVIIFVRAFTPSILLYLCVHV